MSILKAIAWLKDRGIAQKSDKTKGGFEYPKGDEDEKTFMARCMDHMVNEKGKDKEQAVAACLSMWNK
jgi:hypothetical protein